MRNTYYAAATTFLFKRKKEDPVSETLWKSSFEEGLPLQIISNTKVLCYQNCGRGISIDI